MTRWNTWFKAVEYHEKYFDHLKSFVDLELEQETNNQALLKIQDIFKNKELRYEVI